MFKQTTLEDFLNAISSPGSAAESEEGMMGMVALAIIVGFAAWRIEFECLRQRINILDARVKALEERI